LEFFLRQIKVDFREKHNLFGRARYVAWGLRIESIHSVCGWEDGGLRHAGRQKEGMQA
jgi:hypothetical protein